MRLKKISSAEIHWQLVEVYGKLVMSRKQVWFWCTEFDNGRTDLRDEERAGRPNTSTGDENACPTEAFIQNDRRITMSLIAEELNISLGSTHNIVHEQLDYRKTCARWIPRQHTEELKSTRKSLSFQQLMGYHREGVKFVNRIVMGAVVTLESMQA